MAYPTGTLTFLFTDIEGSTQLTDALPHSPDAHAQRRGHGLAKGALEALGQGVLLGADLGVPVMAVAATAADAESDASALAASVGARGARHLFLWPAEEPAGATHFVSALAALVAELRPAAVLASASPWGQE